MPYSSGEGKDFVGEQLRRWRPYTVLDIGVGSGTYARLFRNLGARDEWPARWIGVEIHKPYVERFGLRDLYDELIIGDARTIDLPTCDVAILGDVLEHVPREDADGLWQRVRAVSSRLILSLPIMRWEQGESEGNPHEAHLHHWAYEEARDLPGVYGSWQGEVIGVFVAYGEA